jgi:hypothetical protein
MGRLIKKLTKKGKGTARRAYEKAEKEVMAAVGRKTVRSKVKAAGALGKKAAKAALAAGAVAAASAVLSEVRKRKREREQAD